MRRNIDLTRGLIFSGQLLLDLTAAGMLREDAYRVVQSHAMRSWESDGDFRIAVAGDPIIRKYLTSDDLDRTFSLERQLRHVDVVFGRVFGSA
jgi:adenylosuccinate lyase